MAESPELADLEDDNLASIEVDRVRGVLEARMLGADLVAPRVGRYTILDRLGQGGMGIVYTAYDSQLARKVALKLLGGAEPSDHDDSDLSAEQAHARQQLRARVIREAQAMARLSDPHVAQVYEVGEHGTRTFIAMELVEGPTLRDWQRGRPWRDVVPLYLHAARGLAAAHRAGLVHRDFKPDNAVVATDGRLRVLDFGLVRVHDGEPSLPSRSTGGEGDTIESGLTRDGAIVGTPAYMAPEQLTGAAVDARSDQFAFGVALWEALHGERPFAGEDRASLTAAVLGFRVRTPRPGARVPAWLQRVLLRTLATDPAARFPDMDAIVAALQDDPTRRRRTMLAIAAVGLAVGAVVLVRKLDHDARVDGCVAGAIDRTAAWSDAARDEIESALARLAVPHAASTWERLGPRLDTFATALRSVHESNCLAVTVAQTRTSAIGRRADECLDDASGRFAALVERLGDADAEDARGAIAAAAKLPAPARCDDETLLLRRPPLPDEGRAEIESIREGLRDLRERAPRVREDAEALATRAEATAWQPVIAEAALRLGDIAELGGDFDGAATSLEHAVDVALAHAHDEVALAAMTALVHLEGTRSNIERARWWGTMGITLAERIGATLEVTMADHLHALGSVELGAGAFDEAADLHRRAFAIEQALLGSDHPSLARAELLLGNVAFRRGENTVAREHYTRSHDLLVASLGADHPDTSKALFSVANTLHEAGELEAAKAAHARALAIREAALGPTHPEVAMSLNNMAMVMLDLGDFAGAQAHFERAIAIKEAAHGKDHPEVAGSLDNLARVHAERGEFGPARALYERALQIRERELGPDHAVTASSLNNVALVLDATGAYEEAKVLHRRALVAREKALGPDHPHVAASLGNLAIVHQALGELDEAKALLLRSKDVLERSVGTDHPSLGTCLTNLADVEYRMADYAASEEHQRAALAISERAFGPDHPDVAFALVGLGNIHSDLHQYDLAQTEYERALQIRIDQLGPLHHDVAVSLNNLAGLLRDRKQYVRARELYERALVAYEASGGPDSSDLGFPLVGLAEIDLAEGKADGALVHAERAMALRERADAGEAERGDTRFVLASSLWEAGGSKVRARSLARQARDELARVGPAKAASVRGIDEWLRAHGG